MSQLIDVSPAMRHRVLSTRFGDRLQHVTDWDAPSPVPEWTARDVVAHLGWLPELTSSCGVDLRVPDIIPTDNPSIDVLARFRAQTEAVDVALAGPDAHATLRTPAGDLTLAEVIDRLYAPDLFIHAWDLAAAAGQDRTLDEDYSRRVYEQLAAQGPALQESGHFGAPVPVRDDASWQDKMLALSGRDPNWPA